MSGCSTCKTPAVQTPPGPAEPAAGEAAEEAEAVVAENEVMKAMLGEEEVKKDELSWMVSGHSFAMPRVHRSSPVAQRSVAWRRAKAGGT